MFMMEEKVIFYEKSTARNSSDFLKEPNLTFDELRSKLAQNLQVDHLNFLLGAGWSSYMEKNEKDEHWKEKSIPTMRELFKRFCDKKPDFHIGPLKSMECFDSNLEKMTESMQAVQVVDNTIAD